MNAQMYFERGIAATLAGARKSVLLLGPRQTGKSTLVRRLAPDLEINLSDEEAYLEFLRQPGLLKQVIGRHRTIFVGEVQRIPSLLNSITHARAVARNDLRGLHSFRAFYGRPHTPLVIYRGERPLSLDGVDVLPIPEALAALGFAAG